MSTRDEQAPLPPSGDPTGPGAQLPPGAPRLRVRTAPAANLRVKPRKLGVNPLADMILAELKGKITDAVPKDEVGREMTKAAHRIERKQQATKAGFVATSVHVNSELRGLEDLPLDLAYDAGRDPREDEPYFKSLPPAEQQRLRALWDAENQRFLAQPRAFRREQLHLMLSALAVHASVGGLLALFDGLEVLPGLLLMGLVTGLLWLPMRRTRFAFALAGAGVFVIAKGFSFTFGAVGFDELADQSMKLLFTAAVITFGCGLVGFDCEMRLSGGFKRS